MQITNYFNSPLTHLSASLHRWNEKFLFSPARYYLPNDIPNNNIDFRHSHCTSQLTTPTPKKCKTISNHFSPSSFPLHFLQTAFINTTSFQSLRYFPPLSRHRFHIPCWKPDSNLYIRRLSHHLSMSALNFSSGVQCFLSKIDRHWYCLRGTLGCTSPMHC